MKIAVVCAPGLGDTVIMHIASHQLTLAGHKVVTETPHRFGKWLEGYRFGPFPDCDAIFLQHDNSLKAEALRRGEKPVYTFYGSHKVSKHGELRKGFDYVCDPNKNMVDNLVIALNTLFKIEAGKENGFRPPEGLIHRKHLRRIAIHATSSHPDHNWPKKRFLKFANWAEKQGLEPVFLPLFSHLEELASFIYESGYFLGNDSGPGHIASCLNIPYLIIGREERQMRLWRPGWGEGGVVLPPKWLPNWKGARLRDKHWKYFISTLSVINSFKKNVLKN